MGRCAPWISTFVSAAALLLQQSPGAVAHVYLAEPVSRNFYATTAFQTWDYPGITYCPHCYQSRGPMNVRARAESLTASGVLSEYGGGDWPLRAAYYDHPATGIASNGNYLEPQEISVRHGICGDPEQTAAEGTNSFGQKNSNYPVLETYEEGGVIQVKIVVSTFHWGHLEFFICDSGDLPEGEESTVTQACFNKYPLTRADDDDDASPIDPRHPGRYYLDPPCRATETDQTAPEGSAAGYMVTGRYRLPEGLSCTRCTLQMVYYTGNSCRHPGYEEFVLSGPESLPGSCAPTILDWVHLDPPPCGDGFPYPEEFWNCADIAINPRDVNPCFDSSSDSYRCNKRSLNLNNCDLTTDDLPGVRTCMDAVGVANIKKLRLKNNAFIFLPDDLLSGADKLVQLDVRGNCDLGCIPTLPRSDTVVRTSSCNADVTQCESTPAPTPAPTAEITPAPIDPEDCSMTVGAYGQCGGDAWDGPTCCSEGYACEELASSYHQCRPYRGDGSCSFQWEQCGGEGWDGPTCCSPGAQCEFRNDGYSQCIPTASVMICSTLVVPSDAL